MMNLLDLVKLNLDKKDLNWNELSANPNITLEMIENSLHSSVNEEKDLPWDWYSISLNPNLTIEFINKYLDKPWAWSEISRHPNITFEIILKYPTYPWNRDYLLCNPNLTLEIIKTTLQHDPDIEKYMKWNWGNISQTIYISLDILQNNVDLPWDWKAMSRNPNITIDIIRAYSNKDWDWYEVARNITSNLEDLLPYSELDILPGLSCNPNLTIDILERNLNNSKNLESNQIIRKHSIRKLWDWEELSCNSLLRTNSQETTWEIIISHPTYPWDWYWISQNPNITLEIIEANPNKEWNWSSISVNPNLTIEYIQAHPEKNWDWYAISYNKFNKHPHLLKKERIKKIKSWKRVLKIILEFY